MGGRSLAFAPATLVYVLSAFVCCLLIAAAPLASQSISHTYYKLTSYEYTPSWYRSIAQPSLDVVVGLTHHKTGTFQLHCIQRHLADALGLLRPDETCRKDNNVGSGDVLKCSRSSSSSAQRPAMFKTHHGLRQQCVATGHQKQRYGQAAPLVEPWRPCLSLMLSRSCTKQELQATRVRQSSCTVDLPSTSQSSIAVINDIRNPIDTVISAFMFHVTVPKSEPWLYRWKRYRYTYGVDLKWLGASAADLDSFGFNGFDFSSAEAAPDGANATSLAAAYKEDSPELDFLAYGEVLTALPPTVGVIMEFWHTLPELWSMAQQYQALKTHPHAIQVQFEDFQRDFNGTMIQVLDGLQLEERKPHKELLDAVVTGECDPHTWSEKRRSKSTHITSDREREKEKVEEALLAHKVARKELCFLAALLDYNDDPRCVRRRDVSNTGST